MGSILNILSSNKIKFIRIYIYTHTHTQQRMYSAISIIIIESMNSFLFAFVFGEDFCGQKVCVCMRVWWSVDRNEGQTSKTNLMMLLLLLLLLFFAPKIWLIAFYVYTFTMTTWKMCSLDRKFQTFKHFFAYNFVLALYPDCEFNRVRRESKTCNQSNNWSKNLIKQSSLVAYRYRYSAIHMEWMSQNSTVSFTAIKCTT